MKMKRIAGMLMAIMMAASMMTTAMAADSTLRYNDRGAAVTELQQLLNQLGYTTAVDGVYGPGTQEAVKRFQSDKGLKSDGVAGSATLALMKSLAAAADKKVSQASYGNGAGNLFKGNYDKITRGESSSRVRVLQSALNDLGYGVGKTDGIYGAGTEAAVRWFQQVHGLKVDGKAGEDTLRCIESFFDINNRVIANYATPEPTTPSPVTATPAPSTSGSVQTSILCSGDSGEEVRNLQARLKALGYYAGSLDGQYGSGTTAAVYQFQLRNGLIADGKAGTDTRNVLFSQSAVAAADSATPQPTTSTSANFFAGNYANMSRGESSSRVKILQQALKSLGLLSGAADGVYGAGTESAVRKFQQNFGLTIDGKAGEKTLRRIESCFHADGTVKPECVSQATQATAAPTTSAPASTAGDSGKDVRSIQERLKTLGYYAGTVDGQYGSGTTSAVYAFQLKNGLYADGVAGANTCAKLFSDSAIPASGSAAAPTEAPTSAPTAVPTATPGPQVSIPTRTLYSGASGADVLTVQTRLKVLGYYKGSLDSQYGPGTAAAVSAFQKANALGADGKAGPLTYAVLFSDRAIAAGSGNTGGTQTSAPVATPSIYTMLKKGNTGAAVTQLQKALLNLGYTVNTNGSYTNETIEAVRQFQASNGLSVDGVAGPATLAKLYSGTAAGPTASAETDGPGTTTAGVMSNPPSNSEIKLLHWYNDIKPNLPGQPTVQVYDPASGLTWNIKIFSKGQHADGEPPTLEDTQIMYKAFGNQFTWNEKPVFVKLPSGTWCIASMHDRPHEVDMIKASVNGFAGTFSGTYEDGHLCIHFPRDMSETQQNAPKNGVRHQNDIRKKWKEMTGEDIPW